MTRKHYLLLASALFLSFVFVFFKFTDAGSAMVALMAEKQYLLLPLITIAAIIDSVNPCAISVLFVSTAFLMSLGHSRSRIIALGAVYIAGIFIVYILIGLGILKALAVFGTPHIVAKLAGAVIIAAGVINIANQINSKFPIKLKIPNFIHGRLGKLINEATFVGTFGLGVLVALFEFPCTGGPYLLVLGLLHDKATFINGLFYLVFYNMIFVLPLVIVLFLASDKGVYHKIDEWRKSENPNFKYVSGVLMIALGLLMFAL